MICPFCGKEMEDGRILGTGTLGTVWLPSGVNAPVIDSSINIEERGGLSLADHCSFGLRERYSLTTHICRSCSKGIFDLVQRAPMILYLDKDKPSNN